MNREAIKKVLGKMTRTALILAFLTIFGLVAIYTLEYLQGDTSMSEGLIDPVVKLFMVFCGVVVICRLGSGMIDAWHQGRD